MTKDPLNVEVLNGAQMLGFSGGEMYQCPIIDGDTCTPEPLPEVYNTVIMPNLGLVIVTANGEMCGYKKMVVRSVITMLPKGVGFMTARRTAWDDQNKRAEIEFLNGSLIRESEGWSP